MLITFIIPAYNCEKSIEMCISSILGAKILNYEIIIVNDGSTDNTFNICKKFYEEFNNIILINSKNQGAAAARNIGLKHAKGKYILFCDSDDKYDTNNLNKLLNSINTNEFDLYCFDYHNVWNNLIEKKGRYKSDLIFFNNKKENVHFLSSDYSHKAVGYSIWNKIYKKEIVDKYNIKFPEKENLNNKDDWAEDLSFNLQYISRCNNIRIFDTPAYLLTKHGTQSAQSENVLAGRIEHMIKILKFANDFYQKNNCIEHISGFTKIFIWHMKRYIYIEAQINGIHSVYDAFNSNKVSIDALNIINHILKNKKYFFNRWNSFAAKDYIYLLQYIKTGNMLSYKIKNYLLYKKRTKNDSN